jgi:hypothetical protein
MDADALVRRWRRGRRVGDTREPAHWFAWGEVAPGHGTTPIRDRRAD